uniref:Uncharacterized protein n=1 Tax=Noctiluca scintillans TaxID=2966 RepID=A0A7S0ZZT5_NOCSC|mmetsp:Transcript_26044/g.68415  ORF Transcript_26044/g.68415 Transcript_26044/m.68415 type:complete len:407 (+) Transcript_26044:1-1221(+)
MYSHLPMIMLVLIALVWVAAPMIFCPQPTLRSIREDITEFWTFSIAPSASLSFTFNPNIYNLEDKLATGIENPRANLYDLWLTSHLEHKRSPIFFRVLQFGCTLLRLFVLFPSVYATMVDNMDFVVWFISANFFILALWKLFDAPAILLSASFVWWLTAIPFCLYTRVVTLGTLLCAFILTTEVLAGFEYAALLVCWAVLRPNPDCGEMPEGNDAEQSAKELAKKRLRRYDQVVEYLYLYLLGYQWNLYLAFAILFANLAVQIVLALLDVVAGLHSGWLLNRGLMSGGCCKLRRRGYEPPRGDSDGPSQRLLDLRKRTWEPHVHEDAHEDSTHGAGEGEHEETIQSLGAEGEAETEHAQEVPSEERTEDQVTRTQGLIPNGDLCTREQRPLLRQQHFDLHRRSQSW